MLKLTWKEIDCAMHIVANKLLKDIPNLYEYQLIPICRGGLVPCGILAHLIPAKVTDTVRVRTYVDGVKLDKSQIMGRWPAPNLENMIFVDDIVDTGSTIETLGFNFPKARFVAPLAKARGLMKVGHKLLVEPPVIVDNTEWVEFPWDTDTKPQDKKEHYHG